jgi:hypothetical protein
MGAGAAAAAIQALKASGAIVRLEANDFEMLVARQQEPLVVQTESSFFGKRYQYLTAYKGLVFHTKSSEPLMLSGRAEIIQQRLYGFRDSTLGRGASWKDTSSC